MAVAVVSSACSGSGPQTALEPRGPIARDIDGLWLLVFSIATVVFVLVEAALLVSIFRFRNRKGQPERAPKQTHGNTRLEIAWTIIPAVLLAGLAVPTVRGVFDIRAIPEGSDVIEISVVGHQWWWEFDYVDYGFKTANELHFPAGATVKLTMTSADVIHSFWLPALNGKRDVVPGRTTNLTLIADNPTPAGEPLLGQCAEFCGLAHADMRIRGFVHDAAGFEEWVREQQQPALVPADGLAAEGYRLMSTTCAACHNATVEEADGSVSLLRADEGPALAPDLTHFGSRTTFGGASFDNTESLLRAWLANPSDLKPMDPDRNDLANGRVLGMPNFNLDQSQIDGLITLLEGWK